MTWRCLQLPDTSVRLGWATRLHASVSDGAHCTELIGLGALLLRLWRRLMTAYDYLYRGCQCAYPPRGAYWDDVS